MAGATWINTVNYGLGGLGRLVWAGTHGRVGAGAGKLELGATKLPYLGPPHRTLRRLSEGSGRPPHSDELIVRHRASHELPEGNLRGLCSLWFWVGQTGRGTLPWNTTVEQ